MGWVAGSVRTPIGKAQPPCKPQPGAEDTSHFGEGPPTFIWAPSCRRSSGNWPAGEEGVAQARAGPAARLSAPSQGKEGPGHP